VPRVDDQRFSNPLGESLLCCGQKGDRSSRAPLAVAAMLPVGPHGLGSEESERYHGDPVSATVGSWTCGHDDTVEEAITDALLQPGQMPDVAVIDGSGEFDLDREDPPVVALDDQVDLLSASRSAQVAERRVVAFGVDPYGERHQAPKQRAEQRAGARDRGSGGFAGEEGGGAASATSTDPFRQ
jgi:hypothetical protein